MRPTLVVGCAFLASLYSSSARPTPLAADAPPLQRVEREKFCVTNGVVSALPDGRLAIDTPSSRAVLRVATGQTAEIRFRYLGPSESSKPLASGELRRQIGLKLRAQDTCNLLYAMWHIEPDSRIAVSVKRNPGKHTHEECGARGYVNLKPRTSIALPKVSPGESHALRAELRGTNLSLLADGRVVWEGTVGSDIDEFDGPVGFRTDNARFTVQYFAVLPGTELSTEAKRVCLPSPDD
jgi:hypothetical protein